MKINEIQGINEKILNKGNKVEAIVEVYGENHSNEEILTDFYIPESNAEYKNEFHEKKSLSTISTSKKQQYKEKKFSLR